MSFLGYREGVKYNGPKAGMPVMNPGEQGFATDEQTVYIGTANGNMPIKAILLGLTIKTASGAVLASNVTEITVPDNSLIVLSNGKVQITLDGGTL